MRRAALVVVLAGCNQVFDLNATAHVDAARLGPQLDAAVTCPAVGSPPKFSTRLTQVIAQPCNEYTLSATSQLALATCVSENTSKVFEGRIDEEMAPARGFVPPVGFQLERARLSPDGDFAFVRLANLTGGGYRIGSYVRTDVGSWELGPDLQMVATYGTMLAAITRGAPRHALRYDSDAYVFEEEVESSTGAWTLVGTYHPADLGVGAFLTPYLSPDGLRMVFWGTTLANDPRVFYVDRPDLAARFGIAVPLDVPAAYDPYLTEDCKRLYFTSLDSVFFIEALAQ